MVFGSFGYAKNEPLQSQCVGVVGVSRVIFIMYVVYHKFVVKAG